MPNLKALVVGGYPRHHEKIQKRLGKFLDYEQVETEERMPRTIKADVKAIIFLSKYASRANKEAATEIAKKRHIPFVECETENHVRAALEKAKLLEPEAKPVKAPEAKPELTPEEIWANYGPRTIEFMTTLKLGESISQTDLKSVISDDTHTENGEADVLIRKLVERTILIEPTPGFFMRPVKTETPPPPPPPVVAAKPVEPSAPKPTPPPAVPPDPAKDRLAKLVCGLPHGPYETRWGIAKAMMGYSDFFTKEGGPASQTQLRPIVDRAVELGYVKPMDGAFIVETTPSVQLTPVGRTSPTKPSSKVPPPPVVTEKQPPKEEDVIPHWNPVEYKPKPQPAVIPPPKRIDPALEAKAKIKIPTSDAFAPELETARSIIPPQIWDVSAMAALQKALAEIGNPVQVLNKALFTVEEWDRLAWSELKTVTLERLLPRLARRDTQVIRCSSCGDEFDFRLPRFCRACHEQKRGEFKHPGRW